MINQEVQRKAKSAQDKTASGQAGLSQGNGTEGPHYPETGKRPGPGLQPRTQGGTHDEGYCLSPFTYKYPTRHDCTRQISSEVFLSSSPWGISGERKHPHSYGGK